MPKLNLRHGSGLAAGLLLLALAGAAKAELWRYEDAGGAVSFTDSLDNVPPEFRHTAKKHTLQAPAPQPQAAAPSVHEIKAERKRIIAAFSPAQANAALRKGLLTEDEVSLLVERGALRLTGTGDSIRFARPVTQLAEENRTAPMSGDDRDSQMLRELSAISGGRGAQLALAQKAASGSLNPQKVKYGLTGTAGLAALMFVAYPFVLRNYREDGTRRIIRMSFLFSFAIVAATGNFLLFRDEIVSLLQLQRQVSNGQPINPAQLQK